MKFGIGAIFLAIATASTALAENENWPRWRGPRNDGVSLAKNPPIHFGKTEHVRWRAELPGPAGSTPIVWGDRAFATTVDGASISL